MQPLKLPLLTLSLLCLTILLHAQVRYTITYTDSVNGRLGVSIEPDTALLSPVSFVMPRSVPGNYGIVKYDQFVEHLQAVCVDGKTRPFVKSSYGAPRWRFDDSGMRVTAVTYEVSLQKMDERIHSASDKSICRQGFVGLLNYSVLGWIEGLERRRVDCMISSFPSWPIFSSLAPAVNPARERLGIRAADYYTLADAQTYLGPAFNVKEYKALVPLFVADYTEGGEEYMDDYGWQETTSMAILKDYFGALPFPCYTVLLRNAHPRSDDDPGNFGMEHLQSSTFFGDTTSVRHGRLPEAELWLRMPTFLHHMAHSFIPLRCYGDAYRPYVLEIPPVINNIWFNEGFMWYIVYDTLKQKEWLDYFQQVVYCGSPTIKAMPLQQLSQTASTQYAEDFRLGTAVYSRGAMMAADINNYVIQQTGGKASMRTIYRYLYEWSVRNRRPFTMDEFPGLLKQATGVDVSAIYGYWQQPVTDKCPMVR
jgi:predicted metalloprotease with PDZ domain